MKIRKEFKEDVETALAWITILFTSIIFIGCVYYSYAHFLMDVLKLPTIPLVNKELNTKSEGVVFIYTLIYTMGFIIVWFILSILKKIFISIKNYVFE